MNKKIKLTIIIPVFNEQGRLAKTFKALENFWRTGRDFEVEAVFIDDGSADKTAAMINNWAKAKSVVLYSYPQNRGKGFAIRFGLKKGNGDYFLLCDADMSTPLEEVNKFLPCLRKGVPVVIGTRKANGAEISVHQPWLRENMGKIYTLLASLITGVKVSDFTCGFKCYRADVAKKIVETAIIDRWSYDAEFLFLAKHFGFEITEVPVRWSNDRQTSVRLLKDTVRSFLDLFWIRMRKY